MTHDSQGRIQDVKKGGGSILGLQAKQGDPGGGPTMSPMLKSLQRGPKKRVGGGVSGPLDPLDPPTPRISHMSLMTLMPHALVLMTLSLRSVLGV